MQLSWFTKNFNKRVKSYIPIFALYKSLNILMKIVFVLFWVRRYDVLKMICNEFLVVKVNCSSSVFNIVRSLWLLRNIKNKKILGKKVAESAHPIILLFESDDVIPGKQTIRHYK